MDNFKKLPDEVVVVILSHVPVLDLPQCALVCKRWCRLTYDQGVWTKVDLRGQTISFRTLSKIMERGVRELNLNKAVIKRPAGETLFEPLNSKFKSPLRVLKMSQTKMSPEYTQYLLNTTGDLVELRMQFSCVNHLCFVGIGKNPLLEILDLSFIPNIDSSWISHVLQRCKNLKELNMASTSLGRIALKGMISNLHSNVRRLDVSDISSRFRDKHVAKIVKRCPNLTHLNISINDRLTQASIASVSKLTDLVKLINEQDDGKMAEEDESSGGEFDFDEQDAYSQYMQYRLMKDDEEELAQMYFQQLEEESD